MTTHAQIADRWASRAATGKGRLLGTGRNSNVFPSSDGSTLYSWGRHFPLARIMGPEGSRWFLVNGDNYSVSTTRHQSITRDAIKATGLPSMIVPFSAIERAGIIADSITPVEVLPETYDTINHTAQTFGEIPAVYRPRVLASDELSRYSEAGNSAAVKVPGGWQWTTYRHWLGSAVFTAQYSYSGYADPAVRESWQHFTGTATFLSAFDEQEPRPLYFLAQLPDGEVAETYAQAIEALKPSAVRMAETEGKTVLRQGDVFAIPVPATTREVHSFPSHIQARGTYVLGVNHTATDITEIWPGEIEGPAELTYARGILRHRPRQSWRQPEHRNVKLGDGKTWHRLVLNTVPEGRSWSILGNVD